MVRCNDCFCCSLNDSNDVKFTVVDKEQDISIFLCKECRIKRGIKDK